MTREKVPIYHSISTQFLKTVFGWYLIITVLVTGIQLILEYYHIKEMVIQEIQKIPKTFGPGISDSLWSLNTKMLESILIGMSENSTVIGAKVIDSATNMVHAVGVVLNEDGKKVKKHSNQQEAKSWLTTIYKNEFPIFITLPEGEKSIGTLTIYSSNMIVLNRIKSDFTLIVINAIIKILILWIIILLVFQKLLGTPITQLTNEIKQVNFDKLRNVNIDIKSKNKNEFNVLETCFNSMISNLYQSRQALDQINRDLEDLVSQRTCELEQSNRDLKESKQRAEQYLQLAGVMFIGLDTEGKVNIANKKACDVLECNENDILGKNWFDVFIPSGIRNQIRSVFEEIMAGNIEPDSYYENPVISKIGTKKMIAWNNSVINDHQNKIVGILASGEDITKRRQTEKNLKTSLNEKEVLLRELYHRTKNNMQVISAMLALKALSVDNEHVKEVFIETENRIQAMALVHQKLYQSKDLSNINLGDYINDLAILLLRSYRVPEKSVSLNLDVDDIIVLIDVALPCGLIINELISNSLKYAFPNDWDGKIDIGVCKTEAGDIDIRFSDDGVGLPEDFDTKKNNALGIRTLTRIVEHQLKGTVVFKSTKGTCCRIQFKDSLYKDRV